MALPGRASHGGLGAQANSPDFVARCRLGEDLAAGRLELLGESGVLLKLGGQDCLRDAPDVQLPAVLLPVRRVVALADLATEALCRQGRLGVAREDLLRHVVVSHQARLDVHDSVLAGRVLVLLGIPSDAGVGHGDLGRVEVGHVPVVSGGVSIEVDALLRVGVSVGGQHRREVAWDLCNRLCVSTRHRSIRRGREKSEENEALEHRFP